MSPQEHSIETGNYARKQIFCRSRVVAWSHGSRFELARRLVAGRSGRLLDYGCGDGTFIAMVHRSFGEASGVDVDPSQVHECEKRLGGLPNVHFGLTADVSDAGRWDVVTCMEVLEHCLEDERRRILDELAQLVSPSGLVLISVPIEVGPSLLAKHVVRAIAGMRKLGDYQYRERYGAGELVRGVTGRSVARPIYQGTSARGPYRYHGHKGFDFRVLEREIAARMRIARRLFTPVSWLGPVLNSQAWFVCGRRSG